MQNSNEASAFAKKSPYEIYRDWEEIRVHKDFARGAEPRMPMFGP